MIGRGGLEYAASKAGLLDVTNKLLFEVTERGLPDEQTLKGLFGAKGRTKIALDDFGTGDANLLQYSQMPADVLKIDKYFVDQIVDESDVPKIVKGLAAFALAMDFELIAEGIESGVQVQVLRDLGVQMGQGWHYSKPLRSAVFMDFYSKSNN